MKDEYDSVEEYDKILAEPVVEGIEKASKKFRVKKSEIEKLLLMIEEDCAGIDVKVIRENIKNRKLNNCLPDLAEFLDKRDAGLSLVKYKGDEKIILERRGRAYIELYLK